MEAGRIAEEGTHDSLQAQGGIYAQLVRRQQGGKLEAEPEPDTPLQHSAVPGLPPPRPASLQVSMSDRNLDGTMLLTMSTKSCLTMVTMTVMLVVSLLTVELTVLY